MSDVGESFAGSAASVQAIPALPSAAPTSSIAASADEGIDAADAAEAMLDDVEEAGGIGNESVAATDVDADFELLGSQPVTPTTSRTANAPTEHRFRLNTVWALTIVTITECFRTQRVGCKHSDDLRVQSQRSVRAIFKS